RTQRGKKHKHSLAPAGGAPRGGPREIPGKPQADAKDNSTGNGGRVEGRRGGKIKPGRPERPAPPESEPIANQRYSQSRAHDKQKCWIPRARDVEEALDHGGIGKARQAQPEPEDEAGDQADENLAHVPPLLRSHAA